MSEHITLASNLVGARGDDPVAWISYPEGRMMIRADGTCKLLEGEEIGDVDPADLVLSEILTRIERRIDRLVRDEDGRALIGLWLDYERSDK